MSDLDKLIAHLRPLEGWKNSAYQDQNGFWHIGMGTLIDPRKGGAVSDDVIYMMAAEDIQRNRGDLDKLFPWWRGLSERRRIALQAMAYQLGAPKLSDFKKMLASLEAGDYLGAYGHALNSVWAEQTPTRAKEVAAMLRDG